MSAQTPPPLRAGTTYRVDLVCLGNICRSAMAGVVLAERLAEAGLDVEVVTSGTGGWHVGDPMDARAAATLAAHGYDGAAHRARQLEAGWVAASDLVLAMDSDNLASIASLAPRAWAADGGGPAGSAPARIRLFRDFDPRAEDDRDVEDPYYGGDDGFETVLEIIERTSDEISRQLLAREVAR